jgi:predicted nucleic acid-binding protein
LIRLFLDANVLFTAAHNPSGKAALIVELGSLGYWEVATSAHAIEEARRNVAIKCPECLERLDSLIVLLAKVPSRFGQTCPIPLPPKDRPILNAAIQCKATHLLTGDVKDFGPFMNHPRLTSGIIIQTVSDFLSSLMKSKHRRQDKS